MPGSQVRDARLKPNDHPKGHSKERRKLRVTTFIDRDAVMWLKVRALEERVGYQTLLNRLLRAAIALESTEKGGAEPVTRAEFADVIGELKGLIAEVRTLGEVKASGQTVRLRVYREIPKLERARPKKKAARPKRAKVPGRRGKDGVRGAKRGSR